MHRRHFINFNQNKGLTYFSFLVFLLLSLSCIEKTPNRKIEQRVLEDNTLKKDTLATKFEGSHNVYVPIYSDIYNDSKDSRILLTATLSIRNTSLLDSLYINNVDYYDTKGHLVRQYLDNTLFLRPLETIDYVIDKADDIGGSGANFIVSWKGKEHLSPLFQAVMVGTSGQHGFSFTTNGIPIKE